MNEPTQLTFSELRIANVKRCEQVFHAVKMWSPTDWATEAKILTCMKSLLNSLIWLSTQTCLPHDWTLTLGTPYAGSSTLFLMSESRMYSSDLFSAGHDSVKPPTCPTAGESDSVTETMSATNRGSKRHAADFYATPESAFKPLLPYLQFIADKPTGVWEPACGDGRLVNWMREFGLFVGGGDLDEGYDFLKDERKHPTIITNPPFSLALEFCDHAIKHSPNVFMLLRLNFLASRKRRDWWRCNPPSALFILSERPSFTDDGKTDATDYAWFYWGKLHKGIFFL